MNKMKFDIQKFALGGSFEAHVLTFEYYSVIWTAIQSITGNYSDVTTKVYAHASTTNDSNGDGDGALTVDGQQYSFHNQGIIYSGQQKLVLNVTKRLYHSSTGYKTLNISFWANKSSLYNENNQDYSGSGSWNLDRIYRYATITGYYVTSGGLTSINVSWTATPDVDFLQYSLDGTDWVGASGNNFSIGGLEPNTQHSVKIKVRRTDSQLWTESTTAYVTTTDSAKITNAPNFNDEQNPTISFSNPSGSAINVRLEVTGASIRRDNISNTGQYTFVLTDEERQILQNYVPNSNSAPIRFAIATLVNGSEAFFNWQDRTLSIVNANPQFSNFTYEDINPDIIELTGDNQIIVKGYSNLRAIVSVANKAIAQKGATMVKYRLVVGAKQIDVDYSASADVNLDLNAIDNNVFTIYAIDSRGNSTPKQISPAQYKDYSPISVASASVLRTDSVGEETTLAFNGTIWNDSFGSVANSIISCTYKYKKVQDTTYIDGTTQLTPILSDNTYLLSSLIAGDDEALGFTAGSSFDVQITITDKLSTKTYDLQPLQTAKPLMDVCEDMGVAHGEIYDENEGGVLQVEGRRVSDSTGWIGNNKEWSYSTPNTININADMTKVLQKGDRIKYDQEQALTCLWSLDSNANDSISSMNGTETNITHSTGKFGNGAVLNGTSSKIVIPDNALLKPTGAFTIGMWFKTSSTGATQELFQSYSANTLRAGFWVGVDSTNKPLFLIGDNNNANATSVKSNTIVTDGELHYIVFTFNGNYGQIYLDGKLDAYGFLPAPVYAGTNYVRIGCGNVSGTDVNFFNGTIDDVFLINGYALDEKTIHDKYVEGTAQGTDNIIVTKYAVVTNVGEFDGTNTPITTDHGTDYTLTNDTISNPYYSHVYNPIGFNIDKIINSGWITAILNSAFTNYLAGTTPRFRKVGKEVYITGICKPTADIAGSATLYPIFTLPEGYRTSMEITRLCQGSGNATWLLIVSTDGTVNFTRHRDPASASGAFSTAFTYEWLTFNISFLVD